MKYLVLLAAPSAVAAVFGLFLSVVLWAGEKRRLSLDRAGAHYEKLKDVNAPGVRPGDACRETA